MPSAFPDVLVLDFDGVLHPAEDTPGHKLFEGCGVLEELLEPYSIAIVLSTTWVPRIGFKASIGHLTPFLRSRVIGATWDNRHLVSGNFNELSRYSQIKLAISLRESPRWLAVDDDEIGWNPADADHLALIPGALGLSDALAAAHLKDRLRSQFGTGANLE